jgi:NADPH:quinone reductase-like Zn-dependent oxidoreductase
MTTTMKAVQLSTYGGPEVLELKDLPIPEATDGRVLVKVRATAINPGEASIREGALAEIYPMDFPFGEGSDLAGEVVETGEPVFGWTDERNAHAEYVAVPKEQLAPKPEGVSFEQAGSLYVIGATAVGALEALALSDSDTVVISGAAGGVGVLATQLAVRTGARVIALASEPNHAWLRAHGAEPLTYDGDLAARLREHAPTALLDLFGGGYVALALDQLGIPKERVNTIADFPAVQERGVLAAGNAAGAKIENLNTLAQDIAAGRLELPIANTYPLSAVREAYAELAHRHTHGKIVLLP